MPTKINRKEFWMCLVDEASVPNLKHYNVKDARVEAERLAKTTGKDVFILWANQFVRYIPPSPPPTIEWKNTVTDY